MPSNPAISGSSLTRTELKTGNRPPSPNSRAFPPGSVIFTEGERGRELFIIVTGDVSIVRGSKDEQLELARLGPGAIIGEMSLLDNLPRSATAKAVSLVKAVVINETTFNAVAKLMPLWLTSIIKIIVSRLRDTNKAIGNSILKNRPKGIARLVYILAERAARENPSTPVVLDYFEVVNEILFLTRLKRGDADVNLVVLAEHGLVTVTPGEGTKHLQVPDHDALDFFVEFQSCREQNKTPPVLRLAEAEQALLGPVFEACAVIGAQQPGGQVRLPASQLEAFVRKGTAQPPAQWVKSFYDHGFLFLSAPQEGEAERFYLVHAQQLRRAIRSLPWMKRFAAKT